MTQTEKEIQELLEHNPQHAMELVVEQYTGLVWKITAAYLHNPEDIKDCVQETFMEFYEKRSHFSPAKGTLAAYIGVIAKNRAISCYRRNKIRTAEDLSQETASYDTSFGTLESRIDVEKAIAALKPEETEIIRMKYYCGMTIREIADTLNLPHETVKKRHQRSLKKMRLLLMILLVLILLTACGYFLLRHFGIIPGYGVNYDPDLPIYGLAEKSTSIDEDYSYLIQDGSLWGDTLYLTLNIDSQDAIQLPFGQADAYDDAFFQGSFRFEIQSCGNQYSSSACYTETNENGSTRIDLQFKLPIPSKEDQELVMTLYFFDKEIPFVMERVQEETIEKYSYMFGEHGGLIAVPHWEEEHLTISIYPVSLQDEETICPILIRGMYMEGLQGNITLESQDGTLLTGEPIFNPIGSQRYYDWDFGAASVGEYMLHVPYLYLSMTLPETCAISLDPERRDWEEKVFDVPGGTLSIVSYEPLTEAEAAQYKSSFDLETETFNYWLMELHYEHSPDEDLWLPAPHWYLDTIQMPDEEYQILYGKVSPIETEEATDNFMYLVCLDQPLDPAKCELKLYNKTSVRWMHPFDIPINTESFQ